LIQHQEGCDLSHFTELHAVMSKTRFWSPNNYSCPLTVISDFYTSEEDELIPLKLSICYSSNISVK